MLVLGAVAAVDARAEQTIVFFRHGEKPPAGYGQLTCQGLNRALALPDVLLAKYGRPAYMYAPNPTVQVADSGVPYYYVRPLATLEPTAIRLGMPVNTKYGYNEISRLQASLIRSTWANATIFVAWEHEQLVKVVQSIMNGYGGGAVVPPWTSGDYDAFYVVRATYDASGGVRARFERDREGLNGQATTCP
jgi:hypothetical protein